MKSRFIFISVLVFFLVISFYRLNDLPAEWYGDISIIHEYVSEILSGGWPFYFSLSEGPFHFYLTAPVIFLTGSSYLGYKTASVIIGLLLIIAVYKLSSVLFNRRAAFITVILMSCSFWPMVWARTGNTHIITVPLITALSYLFLSLYFKTKRLMMLFPGVLFASLGMFTYTALFILPVSFILSLSVYLLGNRHNRRETLGIIIFSVFLFLPAFFILSGVISRQKDLFYKGYIGQKVLSGRYRSIIEPVYLFGEHLGKTLLMLHYKGDGTFRINIPGEPQLDRISGIIFIFGLLHLLTNFKYRKYAKETVLIPLFLLIVPALLPAIPESDSPNSARVMGTVPFVFIITGIGISEMHRLFTRLNGRAAPLITAGIFCLLVFFNAEKYFLRYPGQLPGSNAPYSRMIAEHIDSYPENTQVYLAGCCWGGSGAPEPKAIYYSLKKRAGHSNIIYDKFITGCLKEKSFRKTLVILDPKEKEQISEFLKCGKITGEYTGKWDGKSVFTSLFYP